MAFKSAKKVTLLNPAESSSIKARIYDLSEFAVKQALYGMVQILTYKGNISRDFFEQCVDDAAKFMQVKKGSL